MSEVIINKQDLFYVLYAIDKPTIITLEAITKPPMRKRNNPYYGQIEKWTVVNGLIGWNYQRSVNKQRMRENKPDDFESNDRIWGTRFHFSSLVEHKGNIYLEVKVEQTISAIYKYNGNEIDISEIDPFLSNPHISNRQETEKPIIIVDYKLENINVIKLNGITYHQHYV